MPARSRVVTTVAVVVGVALVVAGAVVAYLGYQRTTGPAGAVRAYYRALIDGDAPRALAWGAVPSGPHTLLTSTVLKEQQRIAPMRSLSVGPARRDGDRARVAVHYRLGFSSGAVPVSQTVTVVKRGGDWRLAASAVSVQLLLDVAAQRARIVHAAVLHDTELLFPGAVPISFDSPYLELDPSGAQIAFGGPPVLDVGVRVSATGQAAVTAAVAGALTRCATSGDVTCPLPDTRSVPGSLHGTIGTGDYTITLDSAAAGLIDVRGTVPFHGSYRTLTFANQVEQGSGSVNLDVHAQLYAVAPLRLQWVDG